MGNDSYSAPTPSDDPNASLGQQEIIKNIDDSLQTAKTAFSDSKSSYRWSIIFWGTICFILVLIAFWFGVELYSHIPLLNDELIKNSTTKKDLVSNLDVVPNWVVIHLSVVRILIISTFLTLAIYCFNMLSMFVKLYQYTNHKITLLNSLASITKNAPKPSIEEVVFERLLNIIIDPPERIFSDNKMDNIPVSLLDKLIDKINIPNVK